MERLKKVIVQYGRWSEMATYTDRIESHVELSEKATIRKFRTVQQEGNRQVNREIGYYILDFAEDHAERNIPLTMEDWSVKLNAFLQFNEREVLANPGKVTREIAKAFVESEFKKYRIVQDKLFESDFDKELKHITGGKDGN